MVVIDLVMEPIIIMVSGVTGRVLAEFLDAEAVEVNDVSVLHHRDGRPRDAKPMERVGNVSLECGPALPRERQRCGAGQIGA